MARENHTKFALLGLLSHESLSGYDIKKEIENRLSNFWDIGFGQIYPELKRLEVNNLVTCRAEIQESGPGRKVYTITDLGKKELQLWLHRPVEGEKIRFEILLKLYFSGHIPNNFAVDKITEFTDRHIKKLNEYKIFQESLKPIIDESDHLYKYLTVLFGVHMEKAFLSWAEDATEIIKNNKLDYKE